MAKEGEEGGGGAAVCVQLKSTTNQFLCHCSRKCCPICPLKHTHKSFPFLLIVFNFPISRTDYPQSLLPPCHTHTYTAGHTICAALGELFELFRWPVKMPFPLVAACERKNFWPKVFPHRKIATDTCEQSVDYCATRLPPPSPAPLAPSLLLLLLVLAEFITV